MSKVYVVLENMYEGDDILGIFTTEEEALSLAELMQGKIDNRWGLPVYTVGTFTLDERVK